MGGLFVIGVDLRTSTCYNRRQIESVIGRGASEVLEGY